MTFMTTTGATRYIRHGHACLGVTTPTGLTLTAGGHNNSPLWSRNPAGGDGRLHTWSPWGNGKAADGLPGFNGERPDPVSGSYHLGNGYRAYNPVLRRFNCPDSLSPFGAGGINPYAYCAGDPVNHTDPTGHISWQGILGIVGGTIGVLLTGGAALGAIAAAGSVAAAWSAASATTLVVGGLGLLAVASGIASGATEDVNPHTSSVLGWVSMATGIAGMAAGISLAPKGAKAIMRATADTRQRLGNIRTTGLSGRGAPKIAREWGTIDHQLTDTAQSLMLDNRMQNEPIYALIDESSLSPINNSRTISSTTLKRKIYNLKNKKKYISALERDTLDSANELRLFYEKHLAHVKEQGYKNTALHSIVESQVNALNKRLVDSNFRVTLQEGGEVGAIYMAPELPPRSYLFL
ncbi:RHS repeat-associated core domain-containing protein [Pantoea stewartii]|uniref:RHS repeat-associated core domain-containing protein n=1 Tax=Pantoea stewartii TaxID=66269 RepID=UPI0025A16820|nr:RHS repeat-associated core domain-containing protein [Pantoea stewartii]